MQSTKLDIVLSCLTTLGLFLASCAPAPAPSAQPTAKSAPTPLSGTAEPAPTAPAPSPKPAASASGGPKYGGILTAIAASDPPDLDIHRQSTYATFSLISPCYSGLLQYDPLQNDRLTGDLADRWEMSPDGKVYTFHLRQGIKTHDGAPFTSEDAQFSLNRLLDFPPMGAYVPFVDKVEAPDKDTVRVVLERPVAGWATLAGHGRVLMGPKHVIESKGNLKWTAVGTGPYRFVEYMPGVSLKLVKNKDYFVPGRPYLDGLTFYIIKDTGTQMAAFRTHQARFLGPPTYGISPSAADVLKKDLAGKALIAPYYRMAFSVFLPNPLKKPWDDVRVRRAAFLATDRDKGLAVVAEGFGELAVTWAPREWALTQEEIRKMPGFRKPKDQDIEEARRLMAEAGYPKGVKTSIIVRAGYADHEKLAVFFKDQFASIGIDLELRVVDYAMYDRMRKDRTLDSMTSLSHFDVSDPNMAYRYVTFTYGQMASLLDDPKMIELLDKQSVMLDKDERKKVISELQYRAAEAVPHIPIGWQNAYLGYWPEVMNYTSGYGPGNNMKWQDVWIAQSGQ